MDGQNTLRGVHLRKSFFRNKFKYKRQIQLLVILPRQGRDDNPIVCGKLYNERFLESTRVISQRDAPSTIEAQQLNRSQDTASG